MLKFMQFPPISLRYGHNGAERSNENKIVTQQDTKLSTGVAERPTQTDLLSVDCGLM